MKLLIFQTFVLVVISFVTGWMGMKLYVVKKFRKSLKINEYYLDRQKSYIEKQEALIARNESIEANTREMIMIDGIIRGRLDVEEEVMEILR